jgi:hypothetical protein
MVLMLSKHRETYLSTSAWYIFFLVRIFFFETQGNVLEHLSLVHIRDTCCLNSGTQQVKVHIRYT